MGIAKEYALKSITEPKLRRDRKILLVHTGASFGGVDVYLGNLVSLLRNEAELCFFCSNPHSSRRLATLGARDVWFSGAASIGRIFKLPLFALYLPILRFRSNVDTFWAHGGIGVLLLPWARMLGFHTVLTRHGAMNIEALGGLRGLKHRLVEFLSWKAMRFSHRVICVSETVAQTLRELISEDRLSVIPNWVPVPDLTNHGNEPGKRSLNVLFVGRLEKFKGGNLLIEALRKLNSECEGTASLTIVGEGQCRDEMARLAAGLPVRFVGFQPDPRRFYERADLFVNPSTNPCEGMPLTSLEAMSYGLPCIFSDIPQNREIVGDHASALLFRSGDADELAATLALCASSRELQNALGKRARKTIMERFCPTIANTRYLESLQMIS